MSSSRKAKDTPTTQPKLGTTDGGDWRLLKQPVTPKQRGTTMTLRKTHTVIADKSPTVFPNGKVSTYDKAPSSEQRKFLDEADRIIKEERAKLAKHTPSRAGGSSSNDTPEVDSPPLAHFKQKRSDEEKQRGRKRTKRQLVDASPSKVMVASPDHPANYIV